MMDDSLSYVFFQGVDTTDDDTLARIDMTFEGSNAEKRMVPLDKAAYWNNYYLGHIPDGRPFVPLYTRAVMQDVWPNIDVVYSSNQRGLKYYLVVNPGGEWGAINLKYHGAESLYVDGNDALVIESEIGELVQPQPLAYTMDAYGELTLLGWQPEYDVSGDEVTFTSIGGYSGRLVFEVNWGYVDAVAGGYDVLWSTYYGGSALEGGLEIEIDALDNVYVAGTVNGSNFPTTMGDINVSYAQEDFAAIKFDNNRGLMWATRYGGTEMEFMQGMAPSPTGSMVIVGATRSSGLVAVAVGASYIETSLNTTAALSTPQDGFILELDGTDGHVFWATYYGGDYEGESLEDVIVNNNNEIFVCGTSPSPGGTGGANFNTRNPGGAATVSNTGTGTIIMFNSNREVHWATKYGTSSTVFGNSGFNGIRQNNQGEIFLVGWTDGNDFATIDPGGVYFEGSYQGGIADLFLARWDAGLSPDWATYFGGSDGEFYGKIELSAGGDLLLGCQSGNSNGTGSGDMPLENIPSGTQYGYNDRMDFYLARFTSNLQLNWSSYFGGSMNDVLEGIAINIDNLFYAVGYTNSNDIPTTNLGGGYDQSSFAGSNENGLILRYGDDMLIDWATYFGQSNTVQTTLHGIAARNGRLIVTGTSDDLYLSDPGGVYYDGTYAGFGDITITEFRPETAVSIQSNQANAEGVMIWPNPTSQNLWIGASRGEHFPERVDIELFDLYGKRVLNTSALELPVCVDVSTLPQGTYLVSLSSKSKGKIAGKFVRQ